ncbi:DUF998 domain-containing protein [Thermomonospora umbrina]|uniref:Uncharacterized protein DUF998 n=1 Tax=Thermomonospora umbrina TaxID=111806 RepID=A0A3D9T0W2_9ACTN|nr:DUF998 domain-containing protein [Thermomonospora umbrina]REE97461.1 uncharacterized protein DUF998 [Thermomonospora umbrina]
MHETSTRTLLACGVAATPLFFAVAAAQIATRPDFDLGPHMISQLSAGDHGWIQMVNFVVTGALFVLAAVGLRRTVTEGPGRTWLPRLVGVFGVGLVAAGLFVADPANGYPVGAAEGTTWHGVLHGVAAMASGLALVAATLVAARRSVAQGRKGLAALHVAIGLVYLGLPAGDPDRMGLLFAVASLIAWSWVSVTAGRLMTVSQPQVAAPHLQHA